MDDQLLNLFYEAISQAPAEAVGTVKREDDTITLLDGRLRVRPEIIPNEEGVHPSILHVHVHSEIPSPVRTIRLPACVLGIEFDREAAIRQSAQNWLEYVAPPILSLLHARPVLDAVHFTGSEVWGVPRRHGFVGPLLMRIMKNPGTVKDGPEYDAKLLVEVPLFDRIDELIYDSIPRLVKVTLNFDATGSSRRTLDFGDHELSYVDSDWKPPAPSADSMIIASRFALFFIGDRKAEEYVAPPIPDIDEAIRRFTKVYQNVEMKDLDREIGISQLVSLGMDENAADRLSQFVVIAFGRRFAEPFGARHSDTYALIHPDGHYETGLSLDAEPAFQRAGALMPELIADETLKEGVCKLGAVDQNFLMLVSASQKRQKTSNLMCSPPTVVVRGTDPSLAQEAAEAVSREFVEYARQFVKPKRWWQFWK